MLTKDEIDALMPKPYRSSGQQMSYDGYDKAHCHLFSLEQVRSVANDAIASHTRKVLEDVEPVARLLTWNGPAHQPVPHDGIAARTFAEFPVDTPAKDRYWFEGELLYPASTVAALKARATDWQRLYDRAINEANGLTNYVEDRPELRSAERRLDVIAADARALKGQP